MKRSTWKLRSPAVVYALALSLSLSLLPAIAVPQGDEPVGSSAASTNLRGPVLALRNALSEVTTPNGMYSLTMSLMFAETASETLFIATSGDLNGSVIYRVQIDKDVPLGGTVSSRDTSIDPSFTDIASDGENLYASTTDELWRLITFDEAENVGSFGTSIGGTAWGLDFDSGGTLYGSTHAFEIFTADLNTGQATEILDANGIFNEFDIAFAPDGTLFSLSRPPTLQDQSLVVVDLNSENVTEVGPLGRDDVNGLAFGSDGKLYGVASGASGCEGQGALVSISTSSGLATQIRCLSFNATGATALPVPPSDVPAYVALGDSYSSGEGADRYYRHTATDDFDGFNDPNRCHRSTVAYAELLADWVDAIPEPDFWACSGAQIPDLAEETPSTERVPWSDPMLDVDPNCLELDACRSQLERLDSDTALVTLTIGGNDIGFKSVIISCWVLTGCHAWNELRGLRDSIDALFDELVSLLGMIQLRAPQASVWVLAYPQLFDETRIICDRIDLQEAEWLNDRAHQLNEVIAAAAARVGVNFAGEIEMAFRDKHRACSDDAWVNGIQLLWDQEESLHPNEKGHRRIAEILVNDLKIDPSIPNPEPDPDAAVPDPGLVDQLVRALSKYVVVSARRAAGELAVPGSSQIRVIGRYLAPGARYDLFAFSEKTLLGSGSADEQGELDLTVDVPEDLPAGTHLLMLEGPGIESDKLVLLGDFASTLDFQDISDTVFTSDIYWLAAAEITRGCNPPDNSLYCPGDRVTRGQMAAFLVRALGLRDDGGGDLFVDDDNSIFESDIDRLAAAGITKGCNPPTNDHFCPDDFVTRGQMAAFLVRALGYTDDGGGDLFIDDDGSIFEHDIDRLGTAGVTKGCNPPVNDRFCPGDFVTRGQMAAFLHRALG